MPFLQIAESRFQDGKASLLHAWGRVQLEIRHDRYCEPEALPSAPANTASRECQYHLVVSMPHRNYPTSTHKVTAASHSGVAVIMMGRENTKKKKARLSITRGFESRPLLQKLKTINKTSRGCSALKTFWKLLEIREQAVHTIARGSAPSKTTKDCQEASPPSSDGSGEA